MCVFLSLCGCVCGCDCFNAFSGLKCPDIEEKKGKTQGHVGCINISTFKHSMCLNMGHMVVTYRNLHINDTMAIILQSITEML